MKKISLDPAIRYPRIMLKLSGEAFKDSDDTPSNSKKRNFSPEVIRNILLQVKQVHDLGVKVSLVIGGGNLFRGRDGVDLGLPEIPADHMGMLCTMVNAIALENILRGLGVKNVITMTALAVPEVADHYSVRHALRCLEEDYVVVLAGGTGNPKFTTDSAAALRAIELRSSVIIKATNVDGVYTGDPKKDPKAQHVGVEVTHDYVLEHELGVMDATAFTLCRDNSVPIIVMNMFKEGNLLNAVYGKEVGTLISTPAAPEASMVAVA